MILQMDKWLLSYASLAKNTYPDADPEYPGTGAAGGLGFALQTFLHATLESGIKIILEETRLELRLPGEISITSDMQMTPPLWQKVKRTKKPLDESESGE